MRISWLLVSLVLHGAVVSLAWWWGAYAVEPQRPPARVVVAAQDARAPVPLARIVPPQPRREEVVEQVVVRDVQVAEPEAESEAESDRSHEFPGPPPLSPSEMLQRLTLERVVLARHRPEPAPRALPPAEPIAVAPAAEPAARVEAQRCDGRPTPYPPRERRLGHEGTVVLRIAVTADGSIERVVVLEPSPYPGLDRAAVRAARRWRFEPATEDGVPVASEIDVEVVF
ncbi:MAG TPA: energy transducer TonB, partial [bacterium]|nr:energy transducer TonB [bacterium]